MDRTRVTDSYEAKFALDSFELYKQARAFRISVYRLIRELPKIENYCLATQMRRAAISISNNIAEGHGRWHYQENIQFCRIARGSLEEVVDDLNICIDEGYVSHEMVEGLKSEARVSLARINSYIGYLRKSRQGHESQP